MPGYKIGEFTCVQGGQVGGVQAEAVIYHAFGKESGRPAYFLPKQEAQSRGQDSSFNKALGEFAEKYLPGPIGKPIKEYTDNQDRYVWGRMAMADPKHNPLELNSDDRLNLVFDPKGKLKECFIANEALPDPDFNAAITVQDRPPAPLPAPATSPALTR